MASSTSITNLSVASQAGLITYLQHCKSRFQTIYSMRTMLEHADREYYREHDWTKDHMRSKLANMVGDASKYQDVTVPVVMPQVEAFVAYQASVFLTGTPIFGVSASPKYQEAAMQMEAIIADQADTGRWRAELIKFFRACGKYSIGACEVPWDRVITPAFETDLNFSAKEAKPKQVIWEGNRVKFLDLYNTFWDTQVAPQDVAAYGEYAGYNELITRTHLKQDIAALSEVMVQNIKPAFDSGTPLNEYYIPQLNPQALQSLSAQLGGGVDWFAWAGIANGRSDIAYKSTYIKTTLYIRMVPSEFNIKVPQANTPQVWKLIIINFKHIIYAERQTNAHAMIPILLACPNDDGIKYQTKSLNANVQPMQQVASSMMNSLIASRRRAISDRGIYNPLYIESKDINSQNPAAKIPCKPTAYAGVSLSEMYYPIPFNDDQAPVLMQGINTLIAFSDTISGRNKAQQGQFVKGNKTLHEYESVMNNANGRSQLDSIVLEDQFFTPMKFIINCNILQYQGANTLYHAGTKRDIDIDPLTLRNAIYKFKISDGLTPTDKLINADAWQTAMQVIGSSPAIGPAYDIGALFTYLMETQGAEIKEFQKPSEQLQYEQAVTAWQQTCAAMAKQNPAIKQDQLPPQPKPADFGIGPDGLPTNKPTSSEEENNETIIQKILEINDAQAEQKEAMAGTG